jgi:DNA repair protein RecO (recombination protein O)
MTEFSEKALVLKVGRFRETDLWVRLFSPSRGIMTAFAFGGCKSRKRFCGCLDPLNQVLFKIKSNRGGEYLYLEEGSLISSFDGLRADLGRLGMAANCLKFFEAVHIGPDGSSGAYALLMDTLSVLEQAEEVEPHFPLFFRARLTFEQGLVPDLDGCGWCGAPLADRFRFHVEQGRLVCPDCQPPRGTLVEVSEETLAVLEFLRAAPPSGWLGLVLSPETRRQIFPIVEKFVEYHLGLAWANGHFRRN